MCKGGDFFWGQCFVVDANVVDQAGEVSLLLHHLADTDVKAVTVAIQNILHVFSHKYNIDRRAKATGFILLISIGRACHLLY